MKKYSGMCLPYGESEYHDGAQVPLVRDFFEHDNPENIIGHCILHDTDEGVMCDIHFNERYLSNHTVDEYFKATDSSESAGTVGTPINME